MTELARVEFETDETVVVARVSGEIDMSNSSELQRAILAEIPNTSHGLVIDLAAVTYLDSSGIRMLGELGKRLRWREQRLVVVAPDGSRVRGVLALAGAEEMIATEPTFEAARRAAAGDPGAA